MVIFNSYVKLPEGIESYGCGSKWKTDVGPQMWMSSLVLTIHNFGVPNDLTHRIISWGHIDTIENQALGLIRNHPSWLDQKWSGHLPSELREIDVMVHRDFFTRSGEWWNLNTNIRIQIDWWEYQWVCSDRRISSTTGWWFQTWLFFSISYMGCHPSHWFHYFSEG